MARKKEKIDKIDKKLEKEIEQRVVEKRKKKISVRFLSVLSIVSILGFLGIAMKTLFEKDITAYVEVLWLVVLGFGLVLEAHLPTLFKIKKTGLNSENFNRLVTAVIGFLAILTGIFLLPQIGWITPALLAIQGVISIVAIVFILIESLVLKN